MKRPRLHHSPLLPAYVPGFTLLNGRGDPWRPPISSAGGVEVSGSWRRSKMEAPASGEAHELPINAQADSASACG